VHKTTLVSSTGLEGQTECSRERKERSVSTGRNCRLLADNKYCNSFKAVP